MNGLYIVLTVFAGVLAVGIAVVAVVALNIELQKRKRAADSVIQAKDAAQVAKASAEAEYWRLRQDQVLDARTTRSALPQGLERELTPATIMCAAFGCSEPAAKGRYCIPHFAMFS